MTKQTNTLTDAFGRKIEYLRLSVTHRCASRCAHCMPKHSEGYKKPVNWLSFDEIKRILRLFSKMGLRPIRLTSGKPLLRNRIANLAGRIKSIPGIDDHSLSTNGTQLAKHARALWEAGVTRLNVSLDTLKPLRFAAMTRRNALNEVLDGLKAALEIGISPIKINMVGLAGNNDDELEKMIAFCRNGGFNLRLIETMPMRKTDRNSQFGSQHPLMASLKERFSLIDGLNPGGGPARYLVGPSAEFSLGFITPVSQHFCATCN
ncbi:MAG: radical SAM protein [Propionivibrio sp.]|uniref:Radical SAM protein n=1 Tax=Candidatus Propionivibrio dominans TaxID=2954373 RepID=A0A9D7FCI5_9RHOO|nr:radical SAM protein [Candidatus Propionivibrio dominans]MBL0168203.1 radical SAM protein [Propionivibrio sp.]